MNHVTTDELKAYIEDDVRDTIRMRIEIHLGSCILCRQALDELCVAPVGTSATTSSEQELIARLERVAQTSDPMDEERSDFTSKTEGQTGTNPPHHGEKPMSKPISKPMAPIAPEYHPHGQPNPYVGPQPNSFSFAKILLIMFVFFFVGFMLLCLAYVGARQAVAPNDRVTEVPREKTIPIPAKKSRNKAAWESKKTGIPTNNREQTADATESKDSVDKRGQKNRVGVGNQEKPKNNKVVLNPRTESPVEQVSAILNNIIWDTSALNKQFDVGEMVFDFDENEVTWSLKTKGSYSNYDSYDFHFLDEEGIKIDDQSSLIGDVTFRPSSPPDKGQPVKLNLGLPEIGTLKATKRIKVIRSEF